MVFEAVLVKKFCSDVTLMKIYSNSELRISPWHEKMLVSQGIIIIMYLSGEGTAGVGGGQRDNSGSVVQDALPGPLHLLVRIVAIPPKILK